jgi:hypothetical protein
VGSLKVQWEMNLKVSQLVSEQDCVESDCIMFL